jgi:hypothetical protein
MKLNYAKRTNLTVSVAMSGVMALMGEHVYLSLG